jgi:hypothetical protein
MSHEAHRSAPNLHPGTASLVGGGKSLKSANDSLEQNSLPTKRRYITQAHVSSIAVRMDRLHWAMLGDVGRLGVMSGKQLQRLHFEDAPAGQHLARKKLAQLSSWQLLTRMGPPVTGRGYVYGLGMAGQRLLHPERPRHRPPWTPQPSYLRHALAVGDLYVGLRQAEGSGTIKLVAFDTEPECWRSSYGPGGGRLTLKPDALAVVHLGTFEDRYFIEADCGTEAGPRIVAKARAYVRYWQSGREEAAHGFFPYVLWVTPTSRRRAFLVDVLAKLPPEQWQLFVVAPAEEAAARMAAGTFDPVGTRQAVQP